MPCGIIQYQRRPPTPFDINQLHLIVTLSRQRSGVADQYGSRTENNKTPIDERRTANDRFSRLPLRSRPHILN